MKDNGLKTFNDYSKEEQEELLKAWRLLQGMQFGQIVINVQNGKIVQIEKTEKFRPNEL